MRADQRARTTATISPGGISAGACRSNAALRTGGEAPKLQGRAERACRRRADHDSAPHERHASILRERLALANASPRCGARCRDDRAMPRCCDGERALPHAWRSKHRASHGRRSGAVAQERLEADGAASSGARRCSRAQQHHGTRLGCDEAVSVERTVALKVIPRSGPGQCSWACSESRAPWLQQPLASECLLARPVIPLSCAVRLAAQPSL